MLSQRSVLVGQRDHDRIHAVLRKFDSHHSSLLYEEIDAAIVVDDLQLPADVVRMNSVINFLDLDLGTTSVVELVYPHEVDTTPHGVSILAPVGAALLGLRVGEAIDWPLPNNKRRRLEVVSVGVSA